MTKEWTKAEIAEKIATDTRWLIRSILAIYAFQTPDEQAMEGTAYDNNRGFNGVDAPFLSSLAKQIQEGRNLSQKQMEMARKAMKKYAG
jgi:hypothetical protein